MGNVHAHIELYIHIYMQVQYDKYDCWQHVDCVETARQQIEYKHKSFFCLTCVNDIPSFKSTEGIIL